MSTTALKRAFVFPFTCVASRHRTLAKHLFAHQSSCRESKGAHFATNTTNNMTIDLTLDRIHALASNLPPYTRPTCHIAGTNGKGSVSALLSSIFVASSLTVGRFNSP